ncbi:MAG: PDZ domain-containing protein [Candidatus Eremiobacteraeota bacterium]|nr:PDZ domain-containing protein [Candidatus Eremiobacteraeota bacterium]
MQFKHRLAATLFFAVAVMASLTHHQLVDHQNHYAPIDYRPLLSQDQHCRTQESTYLAVLDHIQNHSVKKVSNRALEASVRAELAELVRQADLAPVHLSGELSQLPEELLATYTDLPENAVYYAGAEGLVRAVDHPEAELVGMQSDSYYGNLGQSGIGAIIGPARGARGILLQTVLPGGAADRAGLTGGDLLLAVDDRDCADMPLPMAVSLLRGECGQPVSLRVRRGDGLRTQEWDVRLVRQPLDIDTTVVSQIDHGVGKVRLLWLDSRTAVQLADTLDGLAAAGVKQIQLDLTQTASGSLSDVAAIASLFLPEGTSVGATRTVDMTANYSTYPSTRHYDFELTVLVGPNTRGTAEALAQVLTSHGPASLTGQPTAGDGLIPTYFCEGVKLPGRSIILSDGTELEGHGLNPPVRNLSDAFGRL